MLRRISTARRHLTFANVMSVIAVFIALGGASYAAVNLPKNSVGTKQLKKKSVGTKQLKGNAVNSNKVKNFSLRANDFKRGQIPSGPTGPMGLPGEDGQPGATGPQGAIGPKGDAGEDATNLFAYIQDSADPNSEASLGYGDGAASVSDPVGDNTTTSPGPYVVTFDRDLSGCVAHATTGRGDPAGAGTGAFIAPTIATVKGATVEVAALTSGGFKDTSFMLSVFC